MIIQPAHRWLDEFVKPVTPILLCAAMVLLMALPYRIPGLPGVMPQLTVVAVFFWTLARPELLPVVAVFAVGLLQDILTGGPMGLNALTLMLVRSLAVSQRQILVDKPFVVAWTGFAAIVVAASLVAWVLAALFYAQLPPLVPSLLQTVLTIAIYPALMWLFGRLRSAIAAA